MLFEFCILSLNFIHKNIYRKNDTICDEINDMINSTEQNIIHVFV